MPTPGHQRAQRILIVEDNPGDQRLIEELLSELGPHQYALTVSTDLAQALGQAAREEFDLVLLDLGLPDSQGLATFARLHEAAPKLPVVVVSGFDDEALALRAVQAGAQDYLVKGRIQAHLLDRTVRYALERSHIEHQLEDERGLLRTLVDALPDQIYIKDRAGRFLLVNTATARGFGLESPAALQGRTDADFFPAEVAASFAAEEQALLEGRVAVVNREAVVTMPDGRSGWSYTTKVAIRDRHGALAGTVGINRDISRRKQQEQQLMDLNTDLARSQVELLQVHEDLKKSHAELQTTQMQLAHAEKLESVGRLAAGIAHEVKNPLAILQMGVDYLEGGMGPGDANLPVVLQEMRRSVQRADAIVRGLLDFSASRQLELAEYDPNVVVKEALLFMRHELLKGEVVLVTNLAPALPRVRVDKAKIEQVLVNALENALQAMPQGGTLTLSTHAERLTASVAAPGDRSGDRLRAGDDVVVIDVEDTGLGIAPENLTRLFDPFFTTKPTGTGTGLGLVVCRRIVDLHHGVLQIGNRPTGGARFRLMLRGERPPAAV